MFTSPSDPCVLLGLLFLSSLAFHPGAFTDFWGRNKFHTGTPDYPRKVFSVSCEVWLFIYSLLFSGSPDLFLLRTSLLVLFFPPLPFVFWKHPQTEEYALIYASTKGMVSCWSVLHLFMATRCAIRCTEERPKIETIHLNRWCLQYGFFPIQKENPFLFVMG